MVFSFAQLALEFDLKVWSIFFIQNCGWHAQVVIKSKFITVHSHAISISNCQLKITENIAFWEPFESNVT